MSQGLAGFGSISRIAATRTTRYSLTRLIRTEAPMPASERKVAEERQRSAVLARLKGWKLEDAKARFSELVRLAREQAPQRVTVYGEDAVVVLSAAEYARLAPAAEQPSLHALLSRSPLKDLDFDHAGVRAPVREVDL